MIGDRMRQARLAAGLTLADVATRLANLGQPITRAGLSKYEHNKSVPKAAFLLKLAAALGVRPSYFLEEPEISVRWLAFRKHPQLPRAVQSQVKATAFNVAEGQFSLQTILYPDQPPTLPSLDSIRTAEQAESAAAALREVWRLGDAPIESVTQAVEDHGGIVIGWAGDAGQFDGLSAWMNQTIPLIVVNTSVAPDRRRFNLAHELAHFYIDHETVSADVEESLAHRFAGAFLVPEEVARRELGDRRRHLSFDELGILKCKYGLSMQAWTHRALDLGIIERGQYIALREEFVARDCMIREPVACEAPEEPSRLRQMTLRALAEGIITEEVALRLCPGCVQPQPLVRPEGQRYTAIELLKLPRAERERILAEATAALAEEYHANPELTEFSALDGEDWEEWEPVNE